MTISRQRKYQLAHMAAGRCSICPRKLASTTLCAVCLKLRRERNRAAQREQQVAAAGPEERRA